MFALNCYLIVLIFYSVSSFEDIIVGAQEEFDLKIREKRYGAGRWHHPFHYKNQNHWSKENSPNWSTTNKTFKPNRWHNRVTYAHNNTLSSSFSDHRKLSPHNYTKYNLAPYNHNKEIIHQTTKPNLKPYIPERNTYSYGVHKPPFQQTTENDKKVDTSTYFNQTKPNFNRQNLKYNRTVLMFNKTNIMSNMDRNKVKPNPTITTYSTNEPNSIYQSALGTTNRTNYGIIKINEIQDTRQSHNVFGAIPMHHLHIPSNTQYNSTEKEDTIHNSSFNSNKNVRENIQKLIITEKEIENGTNLWQNISKVNVENRNVSVIDDIMTSPFGKLDVPTPDFRKPGIRISESKCYEYLWYMKKRIDESDRKQKRDAFIRSGGVKCHANTACHTERPPSTINGRDTIPGEFPHMGALGWKAKTGTWVFKCGSSLISHRFVLTAAHCSRSPPDPAIAYPDPKIVRLGDKNIVDVFANDHAPFDVNIVKIIVHPKYSSPKQYYDIALVELDREVVFTKYIHPACLWTSFDISKVAKEATLTGWGVIETAGLTISPELQAAVVDILDTDKCNRLLESSFNRNWCGFRDHQICAGNLAGGVDACQGDSGGPLQTKIPLPTDKQGSMHFIIGVISFGVKCAVPQLPGIYTRIASFLDWIENIVWNSE